MTRIPLIFAIMVFASSVQAETLRWKHADPRGDFYIIEVSRNGHEWELVGWIPSDQNSVEFDAVPGVRYEFRGRTVRFANGTATELGEFSPESPPYINEIPATTECQEDTTASTSESTSEPTPPAAQDDSGSSSTDPTVDIQCTRGGTPRWSGPGTRVRCYGGYLSIPEITIDGVSYERCDLTDLVYITEDWEVECRTR